MHIGYITIMSRLSQFFWAVNSKKFPSKQEIEHRYTSVSFSEEDMKLIRKLRKIKKDKKG